MKLKNIRMVNILIMVFLAIFIISLSADMIKLQKDLIINFCSIHNNTGYYLFSDGSINCSDILFENTNNIDVTNRLPISLATVILGLVIACINKFTEYKGSKNVSKK